MMPPAPGLLSTRNGRPRSSASRAATSRVTMSTAPPGGNGSMMRTGRSGYSAHAGTPASRPQTAAATEIRCRQPPRMARSLRLDPLRVDDPGPVGDLALQLPPQHAAPRKGRLDVELGEPLAHLRIAHHLLDRLGEPRL